MAGPFSTSNKYAPGLGAKTNGQINSILIGWRRLGIGVAATKGKKK